MSDTGQKLPDSATIYVEECARRLRHNSRDPDALFARAAIHAASGHREKAIAILNDLTRLAPEYPGLWRFKATLYAEVGNARMAALCAATADRQNGT